MLPREHRFCLCSVVFTSKNIGVEFRMDLPKNGDIANTVVKGQKVNFILFMKFMFLS